MNSRWTPFLALLAILALFGLLATIMNPHGFLAFTGEVNSGFNEFVSSLWMGVKILFFTALGLGSMAAIILIIREAGLIRPGKHGPVQAIRMRGGEVYELGMPDDGAVVGADPLDQVKYALELIKLAGVVQTNLQKMPVVESIADRNAPDMKLLMTPLPKVEMFYDLIPYNSLQTAMGIELATGKPVLAPIVKSTHFKLIGGSGQGKSCVAGAMIDIACTTNDPDHLRIGLLDLEHNTSRLFENLPHVAELGPKRVRLIGRDPDEVAQKLKLLQQELTRRANLGEEYCREHEPILLVYVEEMLALKYEVVDEKLKKEMLAAINILGVRARKYGIFLLACMQVDYSDKSTREAMAQFRTRAGFAIDPEAARASGFFDTNLVKENFQRAQPGQYVLEKPAYAGLVLSPDYDVAAKLAATTKPATRPTTKPATADPNAHYEPPTNRPYEVASKAVVVDQAHPTTGELTSEVKRPLTDQEWRIIDKYRAGRSMNQIISSEFTNGKGEPLTGGDLYTQKSKDIQLLLARFLPARNDD